MTQQEAANNVLVATNSSAQTAPNFWVDPRNSVSYPLVVQVPTYRIKSSQDLETLPVTVGRRRRRGPAADESRLLRPRHRCPWWPPSSTSARCSTCMRMCRAGILYSAAADIDKVLEAQSPGRLEGDHGDA